MSQRILKKNSLKLIVFIVIGCWTSTLTTASNGNGLSTEPVVVAKTLALNRSSKSVSNQPDVEKKSRREPELNPFEFLSYVAGLYGDTVSKHALLRERLAIQVDVAIATGTFEQWAIVADRLDQAEAALDRSRQHLINASAESNTEPALLEASLAFADVKDARDVLKIASNDLKYLVEMIQFVDEFGG